MTLMWWRGNGDGRAAGTGTAGRRNPARPVVGGVGGPDRSLAVETGTVRTVNRRPIADARLQ
ncbi:hypothetical protein [Actinomadura sp. HBU206391]|uniref:hypothetical protein n=1 Tax=Actinomadura sp. HBU206391 TaxID=2731692 RepID=UPI0016504DF0|nr:hypothetical protein [Actinomadura sp. HBU206391]MBC6459492.1 hypothetical protein [Actinomadura sp. HBU206391]